MKLRLLGSGIGFLILLLVLGACSEKQAVPFPEIEGSWWNVAGNPMDHKFATERQEPVDFAVWQAADGTWQLWSCMRKTTAGGEGGLTRFFYRWEGQHITDSDWAPMGIAMDADPTLGETPGGLQAPHVVKVEDTWHMFYGDWVNICHAVSRDGKNFERVIRADGKTGMFTEGPRAQTRDVMLLPYQGLWYAYYTGRTYDEDDNMLGKIWVRTTADFENWSRIRSRFFRGPIRNRERLLGMPPCRAIGTGSFFPVQDPDLRPL